MRLNVLSPGRGNNPKSGYFAERGDVPKFGLIARRWWNTPDCGYLKAGDPALNPARGKGVAGNRLIQCNPVQGTELNGVALHDPMAQR
ncbi:hypothetical protein D3C80_1528410 [compost metagenome]